ncbi:MAG: ribulose-phosphate 3-epimerase [Planctomycetota bacterium]|jgi:ribulose-phosphate 3-epimerase|nr:ribulose-phosphate 3-epimerase [Planctomycetota bacterium]
MGKNVKIAPSLLAADFLRLGDEIRKVEAAGADLLHFDVMDGHFVPNISLGICILESVRQATRLPLDVHLMLDNPEKHLDAFAAAGADGITIHLEIHPEPDAILDRIGGLGKTRGLAVNPDLPMERLAGKLARVDRLLIMGVFPGFGGQAFIQATLERLTRARQLLDAEGRAAAELQVDGGIGPKNSAAVIAAGTDCLVAGTAIFRAPDPAAAILALRGGDSPGK